MNKRTCFSKAVCCFVLLMSLNGCIHLIVAKSMFDIIGIHKMNNLEKDVKKLKKERILLHGDKTIKHVD